MTYLQHGARRHGPRGSDPVFTDIWHNIATAGSAWSSGTSYVAGNTVGHVNFNWECILAHTNKEPGVSTSWAKYWVLTEPYFVNGSNAVATVAVPNPVPMRFRLSVGAANQLTYNYTDYPPTPTGVDTYSQHQIEIQGDVTGLVIGDTVFVIPLEYQHDYDVPYHTHDLYGAYVPCRLLKTGEFIWGQV